MRMKIELNINAGILNLKFKIKKTNEKKKKIFTKAMSVLSIYSK